MLITALTGCKSDVQNNNMEAKKGKVIGIGGVFFKSQDPEKTKQWYEDHLGCPFFFSYYYDNQ